MRTTPQRCSYATLILLFAAPILIAAEPSPVPKRFSAHIHSLRAAYSVELRDGTLTYTTFGPRRSNPQHIVITPTEAQWREFRQTLDDLKVWQWRGEYPDNAATLDGMDWSLDIAYADHALKTSGYNAYPDATGAPYFQGGPTNAFRRYLAAIKKLTGGMTFE